MTSTRETFWEYGSFAVVGHSARRNFPRITYKRLRDAGKTVYAVDPSIDLIEGDTSYGDLAALPGPVEAAVLELPKDETADWVSVSPTPASGPSGSTSRPTRPRPSTWPASAASRSAPAPAP